jgi:hypothetical protein
LGGSITVRGIEAPYLIVLQHHDVPSVTRIIAPLTLPQRGGHDGVAPVADVGGTSSRARLLDLAAFPCSVLPETVPVASASADAIVAIVQPLGVIFGGFPISLPH